MKKFFMICLAVSILLSLVSCNRRRQLVGDKETELSETETSSDILEIADFKDTTYGQMTSEELLADFEARQAENFFGTGTWIGYGKPETPYYIFFGEFMYSKLTGKVLDSSMEEWGEYKDALKGDGCRYLACTNGRIYFFVSSGSWPNISFSLASIDYMLGNFKIEKKLSHYVSDLLTHDGKLYWLEYYLDANENEHCFPRCYDPASGKISYLLDRDLSKKMRVEEHSWYKGTYYYQVGSEIYAGNPETGEDMEVICELDEPVGFLRDVYSSGIMIERRIPHQLLRYDLTTGEMTLCSFGNMLAGMFTTDGQYFYGSVDHTTEAYRDSPFYAFFTDTEEHGERRCVGGGEFFRMPVEEVYSGAVSEPELFWKAQKDGIPSRLTGGTKMVVGYLMKVYYIDYTDFNNMYSGRTDVHLPGADRHITLIDTRTGKVVWDVKK